MSKRRSPRLLNKFRAVTAERITRLSKILSELEEQAGDEEAARALARELHTLKGEAKLMGFEAVSRVAHAQEELLERAAADGYQANRPATRTLLDGLGVIQRLIVPDAAEASTTELANDYAAAVAKVLEHEASGTASAEQPPVSKEAPPARTQQGEALATIDVSGTSSLRVDVSRLEALSQVSEELRLAQSHLLQWLLVLDKVQLEAEEVLRDLRSMSKAEVDRRSPEMALESLMDTVASVRNRQDLLVRRLSEARVGFDESLAEGRSGFGSLETQLQTLRLVPISSLFDGYRTAVREMSVERGKRVRLRVSGADVEVDASVLERIEEPLMHIMRNAIDHGIETPEARVEAGKGEEATLTLRASQRTNSVVIQVVDDGRGIDVEAVLDGAVAQGLISAEERDKRDWSQVQELLFQPGFSTRPTADETSGRGIGLDIVKSGVEAMGGTIELKTQLGRGTRVELSVPSTVLRVPILMVEVAGSLYGFPSSDVRVVASVQAEEIDHRGSRPAVRLDGDLWPIETLAGLLRLPAGQGVGEQVVLLEHRERPVAVFIDRFLREETLVVRELSPFVASLPLSIGTSLSSEGRLVVLLNVNELCRASAHPGAQIVESAAMEMTSACVLVVDDSELTRDMLVSLVDGAGYEVMEAVDGRDALRRIRARRPDVVLTDLEMPVMDGFELLSTLRGDPETKDLPVVVCSTRGADADKQRAAKLGADAYVVKAQFSGEGLIRTLDRFSSKEDQ